MRRRPSPLCEPESTLYLQKPAETSLTELDTVVAVARETGMKVACAPGQAIYPTVRRIAEAIRRGEIGTVYCAIGGMMGWGGKNIEWAHDPSWRFVAGNSPLRDHSLYSLATLVALFGRVRRVSAFAGIAQAERAWNREPFAVTEPDNFVVLLDFGDNRFATLTEAWCAESDVTASLRVCGLEGTLETFGDQYDACPRGFVVTGANPSRYALADDPEGALFDNLPSPHIWADVHHLADCVATGAEPTTNLQQMRHLYEIIDAVYRAAQTGSTQVLPPSE